MPLLLILFGTIEIPIRKNSKSDFQIKFPMSTINSNFCQESFRLYGKNSKQDTNVKNARLLNEILFKSFLSKDDGGGKRPPEGVLDVLEILPGLFWLGEANPRFFVTTAQ